MFLTPHNSQSTTRVLRSTTYGRVPLLTIVLTNRAMIIQILAVSLAVVASSSDAFAPSSAAFIRHGIRSTSIPLRMTPPLRPGQKADTTPVDSSDYFKSRGLDVDLEANKPGALDVQTNVYKATDVGDFFEEGYVDELESEIPRCVQNSMPKQNGGITVAELERLQAAGELQPPPDLPGQEFMTEEYWENDVFEHVLGGGIEECDPYTENCIPEGMEFIPGSAVDGALDATVPITGAGETFTLTIEPYCMGYEDYYAGFAAGSHPAWSVRPNAGRMDRRGGEQTILQVICDPRGHAVPANRAFEATLVVVVPEDESKLTYTLKGNVPPT